MMLLYKEKRDGKRDESRESGVGSRSKTKSPSLADGIKAKNTRDKAAEAWRREKQDHECGAELSEGAHEGQLERVQ